MVGSLVKDRDMRKALKPNEVARRKAQSAKDKAERDATRKELVSNKGNTFRAADNARRV